MVILGIDPGTATTGYGLITEDEAGEARLVRYGVITTAPGVPMPERLLAIHRELTAVIRARTRPTRWRWSRCFSAAT